MAIIIPHRFLDRLTSTEGMARVDVIIIGTFNPGLPDQTQLNAEEQVQFEQIIQSRKFIKFNLVRNFYDRPQNRFWKVMDHIHTPEFYDGKSLKAVNLQGLKFYSRMLDRQQVFERQQQFCRDRGILITDIVQTIRPNTFDQIYDNFPDTAIERANPIWNDNEILTIINKHKPQKVIINFNPNNTSIPIISAKINEIRHSFPHNSIISLPSTSGAATMTYESLIDHWGIHFKYI
ncbi:hypothetical protein [Mucilaginibacter dorajii]|uniref:Uncharacterized protein n=1 Tax=Mucilaginibacter dorajii TaxID=692994 RepID=A0ABP7R6W7_9SPHI|nr:hypothetical protein [Mucilaginibacter dorajii]MCS3737691.1 hypothetical protein [Mucilaginibacter dorajii]